MEEVQNQFKNAFAIVIGLADSKSWSDLQMMVSLGHMRFFRVQDYTQAAELTLSCYKEMSQTEKFQMQSQYFEEKRKSLVSTKPARSIILATFDSLSLPKDDARIFMDGYPSIYQIVTATKENLEENSPASNRSIEILSSFFNFET
jgi:hypothetical protein